MERKNTMKHNKLLDRKGNLRVPFYHGTSSLFIDSIRDAGLGGRNPVKVNHWAECFGFTGCEAYAAPD
jgi:hypothetical protein